MPKGATGRMMSNRVTGGSAARSALARSLFSSSTFFLYSGSFSYLFTRPRRASTSCRDEMSAFGDGPGMQEHLLGAGCACLVTRQPEGVDGALITFCHVFCRLRLRTSCCALYCSSLVLALPLLLLLVPAPAQQDVSYRELQPLWCRPSLVMHWNTAWASIAYQPNNA